MLITQELEIMIAGNVASFYRKNNIEIEVNKVNKLPIHLVNPQSHLLVDAKCDICGKEVKVQYRRYNQSIGRGGYYTCSSKCSNDKRKKSFNDKYGDENIFKSDNFKEKSKQSMLKKYGTTHFRQSNIWKDKNLDNETSKRKETIFRDFLDKNLMVVGQDKDNFIINCNIHGESEIPKGLFSNRKIIGTELCVKCNPIDKNISGKEILLLKIIKEMYDGKIIPSYKLDRKEIDIYLPELKLGFEFNGVRWHSEQFVGKYYHIDKTNLCQKNGIRLIHIFEDDFDYKLEIIKSIISNVIVGSKKIYGRKTEISVIKNKNIIKDFLNKNHLQGFVNSNINYGLYYDGELVSLMTFMKSRKILNYKTKNNHYELIRFCNKLNHSIIGGASKLFKKFIDDYSPEVVISYCDISWANGNLYKQLGFNYDKLTDPNYYYVVNGKRENRIKYQKHKLIKDGFDGKLTEKEIMNERGYYRLYNCGNGKYIFQNKYSTVSPGSILNSSQEPPSSSKTMFPFPQ